MPQSLWREKRGTSGDSGTLALPSHRTGFICPLLKFKLQSDCKVFAFLLEFQGNMPPTCQVSTMAEEEEERTSANSAVRLVIKVNGEVTVAMTR